MHKHKSTIARALEIQRIVSEHYEPGRQDRCKSWIYRNIVKKQYAICERTFFDYLSIHPDAEPDDKRQLKLF